MYYGTPNLHLIFIWIRLIFSSLPHISLIWTCSQYTRYWHCVRLWIFFSNWKTTSRQLYLHNVYLNSAQAKTLHNRQERFWPFAKRRRQIHMSSNTTSITRSIYALPHMCQYTGDFIFEIEAKDLNKEKKTLLMHVLESLLTHWGNCKLNNGLCQNS